MFDVHTEIQRAFNWDNDHLYSFYLSSKVYDIKSEYAGNPYGDIESDSLFGDTPKSVIKAQLRDLKLTKGKYLFISLTTVILGFMMSGLSESETGKM